MGFYVNHSLELVGIYVLIYKYNIFNMISFIKHVNKCDTEEDKQYVCRVFWS